MIRLIDLTYYTHQEFDSPAQVMQRHQPAVAFAAHLDKGICIQFVKHANFEGHVNAEGIDWFFFKSRNKFWHIPFKTHRFISNQQPDVVLIQGFVFPLQLMALRLLLGRKCKLVVQHHGERPFGGIKAVFQMLAGFLIDAYVFTSQGNAAQWLSRQIIKKNKPIFEILEASTNFTPQNKELSKTRLKLNGDSNFLWVGRLNANKNPLLVLNAFAAYLNYRPDARLYMIYHEDDLLPQINALLLEKRQLKNAVWMAGKIAHHNLPFWFSAADYYLAGSYSEGSSYALLEAMACGCIPVVTDIPANQKITANGTYGFLYPPGDEQALLSTLLKLNDADKEIWRGRIIEHFNAHLGFKNIAAQLSGVCYALCGK